MNIHHLNISDGDTLLISFDQNVDRETANDIIKRFEELFPSINLMAIRDGCINDISIINNSNNQFLQTSITSYPYNNCDGAAITVNKLTDITLSTL